MKVPASEYPTEDQMKEIWVALESDDDQAVLEVLRKRRAEREEKDAADKVDIRRRA